MGSWKPSEGSPVARLGWWLSSDPFEAWPLVEVSLTDRPASADARITSVRSAAAHYQTIGVPVAGFKMHLLPPPDPSPEEREYAEASAAVDRIEARKAWEEYRAICANIDRRH